MLDILGQASYAGGLVGAGTDEDPLVSRGFGTRPCTLPPSKWMMGALGGIVRKPPCPSRRGTVVATAAAGVVSEVSRLGNVSDSGELAFATVSLCVGCSSMLAGLPVRLGYDGWS